MVPNQSHRRLVIHAGLHKTATTSLQVGLLLNSKELAKNRIFYPSPPQGYGHHHLVAYWNDQLRNYLPHVSYEADWQALNKISSERSGTVIISSEEFSRKSPVSVDFNELIQMTPDFDSHEIVIVLREQLSLLQSVFLQIRKHNSTPVFSNWIQGAISNPHNPGLFFKYLELHEFLIGAFKPDKISYLNYKDFGLHSNGVVGSFVEHIGVSHQQALKRFGDRNVSIDPLGYYLGRSVLNGKQPSIEQIELVTSVLFERHPEKVKSTLYSKSLASKWRKYFKRLNEDFHAVAAASLNSPVKIPGIEEKTLYLCEITDADRIAISKKLTLK